MLNIRTTSLSVMLALILLLTVTLMTVRSEAVLSAPDNADNVPNLQEPSTIEVNMSSLLTYRSQFGECFDVSIKDHASCHDESLYTLQAHPALLDECFDVSLMEAAGCRNAIQTSVP